MLETPSEQMPQQPRERAEGGFKCSSSIARSIFRLAALQFEKGTMRRSQLGSDDSVQATANDAVAGKLSASSLGYFEDRFLEMLVGNTKGEPIRRLPPVINRGIHVHMT